MGGRPSNPEPPVVQALLRLEFGRGIVLLQPQEAVLLRNELRAIDDPSAVRLAIQIDAAATMLLAAPLHAGVRAVRVADDEEILRAHAQPFVRGVTGAGEGAEEQEQENCRERPQDWNCRSAAGWSVHARLHERAAAGCSGFAKSFRLHGFLKYTRRPRR